MKKYLLLLLSFICFNSFPQSYKKILTYINKAKFHKAHLLLAHELKLYEADIYSFPKSKHSAFINPNLNYLVYLFITSHHAKINSYDTLDLLNWHINAALAHLPDSLDPNFNIVNRSQLKAAHETIDRRAYQILQQNYTSSNIEHFIAVYSQDFKIVDIGSVIRDYLYFNFIQAISTCKMDRHCIETVSLYYQSQHQEEKSKTFIAAYADSLIYNHALDTNKIDDLEFYIRHYTHKVQIERAQHNLFGKLLEGQILTRQKLNSIMKRYGDILCQDRHCSYNPSSWLSVESVTDSTFLLLQDSQSNYFGFKTPAGKTIISPKYDIPDDYLRTPYLKTDFFKVYLNKQLQVLNAEGEVIISKLTGLDDVSNFDQLTLLTYKKGFYGLYHKNGFEILEPQYESIEPLAPDLIKIKQDGRFGVVDYLNNLLLPNNYDDIIFESPAIFARVLDTYHLFKLIRSEGKVCFQLKRKIKSFMPYSRVFKVVSFADKMALLDSDLNPIIENLDSLAFRDNFFIAKRADNYFILDSLGQQWFLNLKSIQALDQNQNYWAFKVKGLWGLYDKNGHIVLYHRYKKLQLLTSGAILTTQNEQQFYYHKSLIIWNRKEEIRQDIHRGGKYYAAVGENKTKLLEIGKQTLLTNYDAIELFENGNIILERNGLKKVVNVSNLKKNIFGQNFQEMIPSKHDPFGFQTFKASKFGFLHILNNWYIPNIYEQSLKICQDSLYIAKKDGALGLINQQNKVILEFDFKSIKPYRTNLLLLERRDTFQIYNVEKRQILNLNFTQYTINQEYLIFNNKQGFGILKPDGQFYFKKTYEVPLQYEGGNVVITLDKIKSCLNWYTLDDNLINRVSFSPAQYRKLKPFLVFTRE